MMETKYGYIQDEQLNAYLQKLIGRLFKIVPMNEEGVITLESYVDSLLRELIGNSKVFLGDELLSVCGTLKGLDYSNQKLLKSDIFKAIELIDRTKGRVK